MEWSGEGVWKSQQHLAWRCDIGRGVADKIVALAERAGEPPETAAAVRSGELSLDQAAPITKRVPGWAERRVVSLAKRLTVRRIQRIVAQYDFTLDAPSSEPGVADDGSPASRADGSSGNEAAAKNTDQDDADELAPRGSAASDGGPDDVCWSGTGDDGRWRMDVETTRDTGDVIALALDEARDTEFRRDGGNVSALDALREMSHRSLDAIDSYARRERHRINVHLHTDGAATDDRGVPLPDSIRRHITCNGIVSPILLEIAGTPINPTDSCSPAPTADPSAHPG